MSDKKDVKDVKDKTESKMIDMSKVFIEIKCKKSDYYVIQFLNFIAGQIGGKTKLNYHMTKIQTNQILIPIYPYESQDLNMRIVDLIHKRVDELVKYFEDFDWKSANKTQLWVTHALQLQGINLMEDFLYRITTIPGADEETEEAIRGLFPRKNVLPIKPLSQKSIIMKQLKTKNGDLLTVLIDPFLRDYGIYVDLSVPFVDMGMGSNTLHLFEHMMTKGWKGLDNTNHIYMNGATTAVGTSWVYTLHETYDSFKLYFNSTLKFLLQCRNKEFWESPEMKKELETETVRTISETRMERSTGMMARSDLHAYNNSYNINIFHYWSNRPLNLLVTLTHEDELTITEEKWNEICNKHPPQQVKRPPNLKFKDIPVEVLFTKMIQQYRLIKTGTDEIIDRISKHMLEPDVMYGIDCELHLDQDEFKESTENGNILLHPLLFYNRWVSLDHLQHFVNTHVIPYTNTQYGLGLMQHAIINEDEL